MRIIKSDRLKDNFFTYFFFVMLFRVSQLVLAHNLLLITAEYDSMHRLGISSAKDYIKKRLKNESLLFMSSCCVGKLIQEQLEAQVDEAIATVGWIDVTVSAFVKWHG